MPPRSIKASQQALAKAVARHLYGFRPTTILRAAVEGSSAFRVDFGGLPPKVIKLPGRAAGLLREQRVIRQLRRRRLGLPVPAIEFTQEDLPPEWKIAGTTWSRPSVVTVMRHESGMSLADAILRGEPWAGDAMREAGSVAARLAQVPTAIVGRTQRAASAQQIVQAAQRVEPVLAAFSLSSVRVTLERLADIRRRPVESLAHGAFHAANLRGETSAAGMRLCLFNWEAAGSASALCDLAALTTSPARLPLNDPGQGAYLRRRAIDGFAALRPLDHREMRELTAWEVFWLLGEARLHLDAGRTRVARDLALLAEYHATS